MNLMQGLKYSIDSKNILNYKVQNLNYNRDCNFYDKKVCYWATFEQHQTPHKLKWLEDFMMSNTNWLKWG